LYSKTKLSLTRAFFIQLILTRGFSVKFSLTKNSKNLEMFFPKRLVNLEDETALNVAGQVEKIEAKELICNRINSNEKEKICTQIQISPICRRRR
jgi:hypothetical protein